MEYTVKGDTSDLGGDDSSGVLGRWPIANKTINEKINQKKEKSLQTYRVDYYFLENFN